MLISIFNRLIVLGNRHVTNWLISFNQPSGDGGVWYRHERHRTNARVRFGRHRHHPSLLVMFHLRYDRSFVSLLMSKWLAKRSTGTQVIEQPSTQLEVWLVETVRRLAQTSILICQKWVSLIIHHPMPFATGWNKTKLLFAVSTGLLQSMNQEEVEAVFAHEIGHVANGDMVTLALVQGVWLTAL